MCRSLVQMLESVTRTTASLGLKSVGLGFSAMENFPVPSYIYASMIVILSEKNCGRPIPGTAAAASRKALPLVALFPDMHLLCVFDQFIAELRVCDGDDGLGLLPGGKAL